MIGRVVAVITASLVVASCSSTERTNTAGDKVEIGAPAPAYATTSVAGDSVSLAGLRGKVVLLNVWATWCGPCRQEIPELRSLHAAHKARGLELIGVTVDTRGADEAIRAFVKEFQMTYPIWLDPDELVLAQFRVVGLPASFLIDKEGILRWKTTGPVAPNDTALASAINRALGG